MGVASEIGACRLLLLALAEKAAGPEGKWHESLLFCSPKSKGKGFAGCRLYGNAMSRRSHNKASLYNRLADKLAVRLVVLKS
jgi:hypothetical protein